MTIREYIRSIASTDCNQHIEEIAISGTPIIGTFCSTIPEEILIAAQMVPFRMRAVNSHGTTEGDAYFSPQNCSFVRHCFNKVLKGDFQFLSGIIFTNGCDHTRRIYDNWRYAKVGPDFKYFFVTPHVTRQSALDEYCSNIKKLIQALEKHFGCFISEEKIHDAILKTNEKRRLLNRLELLRAEEIPGISGTDFLQTVLAITAVPNETAIEMLQKLIDYHEKEQSRFERKIRLLYLGGGCEDWSRLHAIESVDVAIVADSLCFGSRYGDMLIDEKKPVFEALAERYLRKTSCPRMMDDWSRRLEQVFTKVHQRKIHGIVLEKLKFCDLWGWEAFRLKNEAHKRNIPFLFIETELYGQDGGQLKTRIQAFIEQIRNRSISFINESS